MKPSGSFSGALLGCAVGDALGAPFEGLWPESIPETSELLSRYHLYDGYESGQYTDDTQLTLATAEAIVASGQIDPHAIASRIAELWRHHTVIGPGGACTQAAEEFLLHGDWTTCGAPVGQAGNGTAMRTVFLGLCFPDDPSVLPRVVSDISRITHQDPRSIAGGVAVAEAARQLAYPPKQNRESLLSSVAQATSGIDQGFADCLRELDDRMTSPEGETLRFVASAGQRRAEFDRPIITPFVVPTVLASLWSVLRHPTSWSDAVAFAIRLGGDVDTLGAIVGALMGAKLGSGAIPQHLRDEVVDSRRMSVVAAELDNLFCPVD